VLDRAYGLLALDTKGKPLLARQDVRRLAWALGVSAIDTQLHWLIRRVDLDKALPGALAKVPVRFDDLVATGRLSVQNRRDGKIDRPTTRARNVLNEVILTKTFQSADQVQDALSMIGISSAYVVLAAAIKPAEPPASIKARLNALTHRRNAIVHEGDLARLMRPQTIKRGQLTNADVRDELDWIRGFILAVNKIT
jgi:hypothetical protein